MMRPNMYVPVAALALLIGCGPSDIDKDDMPVIVTGNNAATNNQAANATPNNVAANNTTQNGEPGVECSSNLERLVDGECIRAEQYVSLNAGLFVSVTDGNETRRSSLGACVFERVGEPTAGNPPDVEEGGCRAWRISPDAQNSGTAEYEASGRSAGAITFDVGGRSAQMLAPTGENGCYQMPEGIDDLVDAGDAASVTVEGAGGIPGFEADFAIPALVEFETSQPRKGETLELFWEPTGSEGVGATFSAYEVVDGESFGVSAVCTFDDTGSAEIPASIMELLPESPSYQSTSMSQLDFQSAFEGDTAFTVYGGTYVIVTETAQ